MFRQIDCESRFISMSIIYIDVIVFVVTLLVVVLVVS